MEEGRYTDKLGITTYLVVKRVYPTIVAGEAFQPYSRIIFKLPNHRISILMEGTLPYLVLLPIVCATIITCVSRALAVIKDDVEILASAFL